MARLRLIDGVLKYIFYDPSFSGKFNLSFSGTSAMHYPTLRKASPCHCVVSSRLMETVARDLHNVGGLSVLRNRTVYVCVCVSVRWYMLSLNVFVYICVRGRKIATLWYEAAPGAVCFLCTHSLFLCPLYCRHAKYVRLIKNMCVCIFYKHANVDAALVIL